MVHFECSTCGVSATCVLNTSAEVAWYDHMANHALVDNFRAWTWEVVPLPLEEHASPVDLEQFR